VQATADFTAKKIGLSEAALSAICGVFAGYPAIRRVLLYGSRAKGSYRPGSDIDLTVDGSGVTENERLEMESRLDDLLLPNKIDLSLVSSIKNPSLLDHIQRVGIVIYETCKTSQKARLSNH